MKVKRSFLFLLSTIILTIAISSPGLKGGDALAATWSGDVMIPLLVIREGGPEYLISHDEYRGTMLLTEIEANYSVLQVYGSFSSGDRPANIECWNGGFINSENGLAGFFSCDILDAESWGLIGTMGIKMLGSWADGYIVMMSNTVYGWDDWHKAYFQGHFRGDLAPWIE